MEVERLKRQVASFVHEGDLCGLGNHVAFTTEPRWQSGLVGK